MTIEKLNYIKSIEGTRFFNVNDENGNSITFIADIERNNNFSKDQIYNKNCLLDTDKNKLLHNMYRSDCNYYKVASYKLSKPNRTNTTYDFNNVTNHRLSSQLTNIIKVENALYGLEQMNQYSHYSISEDAYSYISAANGYTCPELKAVDTIIFNKTKIKEALENSEALTEENTTLTTLNYVEYNTLYEIPAGIYNDFESGNVIANTYIAKNQYNSEYNMMHDDTYILKNTREYSKIDNCNNIVYLKYYDKTQYNHNAARKKSVGSQTYNLTYEHIEVIDGINRELKINKHSTNLYDITLKTDLLKKLSESDIREKIRKEIQHNIRIFANALEPAQTQLLSVYVEDV